MNQPDAWRRFPRAGGPINTFQGSMWKLDDAGREASTDIPRAGQGTGGGNYIENPMGVAIQGVLLEEYMLSTAKSSSWEYVLPGGSAGPVHIALVPYS